MKSCSLLSRLCRKTRKSYRLIRLPAHSTVRCSSSLSIRVRRPAFDRATFHSAFLGRVSENMASLYWFAPFIPTYPANCPSTIARTPRWCRVASFSRASRERIPDAPTSRTSLSRATSRDLFSLSREILASTRHPRPSRRSYDIYTRARARARGVPSRQRSVLLIGVAPVTAIRDVLELAR